MIERREFAPREAIVPIIHATPGMDPAVFESVTQNADGVIFVVFGTGGSPGVMTDAIRRKVESGVPVFLVADKTDDHGIIRMADQSQVETQAAGAIPLQKVNYTNIQEISAAIAEEFRNGKRGAELGKAIQEKFSYKEGEERPVPAWEDPERVIKTENE